MQVMFQTERGVVWLQAIRAAFMPAWHLVHSRTPDPACKQLPKVQGVCYHLRPVLEVAQGVPSKGP